MFHAWKNVKQTSAKTVKKSYLELKRTQRAVATAVFIILWRHEDAAGGSSFQLSLIFVLCLLSHSDPLSGPECRH